MRRFLMLVGFLVLCFGVLRLAGAANAHNAPVRHALLADWARHA